jgi:hypothetical protein
MMTNLTLNQQDADSMRHCINELLHQMNTDYQQAKTERHAIRAAFSNSDEAFNLLEELELLTADLRGYASQIQVRGWVEQDSAAIAHLRALRLYRIPAIAQFYLETPHYPLLKEYIRRLDYLRLLLLEYLQVQSKSA